MPDPRRTPWLDDDAGRLVRPYTVSDGRTKPTAHFDLMTMVVTTKVVPQSNLDPDHAHVLDLCARPITVAEISAHMGMPATVVKVLLSDLVDNGAITTRAFTPAMKGSDAIDLELLEAVMHGLRKHL
jgi:uncharacterized protein DUF742